MVKRTWLLVAGLLLLVPLLLVPVAGCSDDDTAAPDSGILADTGTTPDTGKAKDTGTSKDTHTGLPEVKSLTLLGVAADKDFDFNGKVHFTLLPVGQGGNLIINKGLAFGATATSPSGLTPTVVDKQEQRPPSGQPLVAGLLFDSSGSMASNDPKRLRVEAAKQFIDQLDKDDQVAIGDFGAGKTGTWKATRLLQTFTTDKAKAKAALTQLKASGGTPMFESVSEVLFWFNLLLPAKKYPHRALLVLGDGQPNGTGTLLGSCTTAVAAQIPVNTIGFGPAAWQSKQVDWTAVWNLGALAVCSKGLYSSVAEATDLSKTYLSMSQMLKKGSVMITVRFSPIPDKKLVSGTLSAGNGAQAPVTVQYAFYAP